MEQKNAYTHNKGGRPKKCVKRDQKITVMCSLIERKVIEHKAKAAGLSVSEYLRNLGLNRQVDTSKKALPKEVLLFTATLNHLAANINQIARKRNQGEELNALERAALHRLPNEIQQLANYIKTYLK